MDSFANNITKPFLRWAGGKGWLIKHLDRIIGDIRFQNYHEPFLGGGAIFFALEPTADSYLSDLNPELVETYIAIKNDPLAIIEAMRDFENSEDFYYRTRATICSDPIERAARFIYLNQTSFNGLYRVNQEGKYNVPYGFRTKPFLEENQLIRASQCLQNAIITCGDFNSGKNQIHENDLVFLDPPYTVSHNNNGFIKYNQKLFSLKDQERLSKFVDYIKNQGAYYILTNAAHPVISEIFNKGDTQIKFSRASLIGGLKAVRGQTAEYVFTNIVGGAR